MPGDPGAGAASRDYTVGEQTRRCNMTRFFGIVFWFGLSFIAAHRCPAEWRVWTVTDTRRVLRDDAAGTVARRGWASPATSGAASRSSCAPTEPVEGVRVEPGDLRGPGGHVLRAADARLYRQHQFELTVPPTATSSSSRAGIPTR